MGNSELNRISPPGVIGIIGGGQLGRMSALAARAMGYRVVVLEPNNPCACTPVVDEQIVAEYDDAAGLERLFSLADVVAFEFENVQKGPLESFAGKKPVRPSPLILSIAQNREREKSFFSQHGFPVAPFRVIGSDEDVEAIVVEGFQFPAILKTADFGYDGKGQVSVDSPNELMAAWKTFAGARAVLEEKIHFLAEYSMIIVRSPSGDLVTYPLCRNIHRNHILDLTYSPAVPQVGSVDQADQICREVAEKLELEGVLVIELFLTEGGDWIINEMAPRPHNSGHFSIDGSDTSQFENHIRSVCNQPLGSTGGFGVSAMINLLGDELQENGPALAERVLGTPGAHLHLYDKGEAKSGRKMGHINLVCQDSDLLQERVVSLRDQLGLPPIPYCSN